MPAAAALVHTAATSMDAAQQVAADVAVASLGRPPAPTFAAAAAPVSAFPAAEALTAGLPPYVLLPATSAAHAAGDSDGLISGTAVVGGSQGTHPQHGQSLPMSPSALPHAAEHALSHADRHLGDRCLGDGSPSSAGHAQSRVDYMLPSAHYAMTAAGVGGAALGGVVRPRLAPAELQAQLAAQLQRCADACAIVHCALHSDDSKALAP
jgi:hypothetical protein